MNQGFESQEAMMAELDRRARSMGEHQKRITAAHPDLPYLTVIIMANDAAGADAVDEQLRKGEVTFEKAVWWLGSYSRMERALQWQEEGFATRDELLDLLPHLWPASDPDDTDPRFLALFTEAAERNNGAIIDGDPLPEGRTLTIYRGQRPNDEVGFAWSLDRKVAEKFAKGASFRTRMNGVVLERTISREEVLGYFTGRNEAEVIVKGEI